VNDVGSGLRQHANLAVDHVHHVDQAHIRSQHAEVVEIFDRPVARFHPRIGDFLGHRGEVQVERGFRARQPSSSIRRKGVGAATQPTTSTQALMSPPL
jgi:hypothetical protein